ncbi:MULTISPECIES: triphosphoribosyl-dephospho-CoA synthase CitG [Glaesserella]|uniref:Probable 2-(5''-triphosphoribosyl)-3'-dephosphocoenzyme-A synthase n=1 Tax=Glaesserella australis TaxID=2094024 RepID=A0A328C1X0_9PAST|nr:MULTISPECIES: triphosphoribosyl-dephospho-CoA synthase CitG [Glaesserella]AUI65574.1 2-(5'-triphosphoribosyl)-3'-dephospho CoA synthase [Glaesserella sp. 15-184]RAL19771.1 2-(5'-triphosphoribosyl)-3'-dephospho CoA synthase [Glaesserella australis]
MNLSLKGTEISLEQLLAAREERMLLQQRCLQQYGQTVLSVTLLACGAVKKNSLLDHLFAKCLAHLTALFSQLSLKPTEEFIRPLETGHEALFVLPIDAKTLKQAVISLEESSPLARLWDIDVIDSTGKLLSRSEFGFNARPCLLCSDDAKQCARSRKHAIGDILAEMQQRVLADEIAERVSEALLEEAYLTPKAGLVDRVSNGSHQDMDIHTFEASSYALRPFFAQFVRKGIATSTLETSQILAQIRPLGLQAEQAMLQATGGVNTHKGAIFAFGLVCCAIGRLFAQQQPFTLEAICELVSQFTQGLTQELQHYPENLPLTAGVKLFRQFGLTGARGEAEQGFPLVRMGYQWLKAQPQRAWQHQLHLLLLQLMAKNQDTNVVHRGGMAGLAFVQQTAKALLADSQIYQDQHYLEQKLHEFDLACIERHLSAGGSADLLALTIFFYSFLL